MSDKPVAIFTTWLLVTPVMVVCCLGTVFLGSALAGAWEWLGGAGLPVAAAVAIVAGLALYGLRQRRRRRQVIPETERSPTPTGP